MIGCTCDHRACRAGCPALELLACGCGEAIYRECIRARGNGHIGHCARTAVGIKADGVSGDGFVYHKFAGGQPCVRIIAIHERSVRVPHISVYRNGDAVLIQHMRIAARVVDAHLNPQLVFPFREGRSRVFFPFCTVVFYPCTRSRGEICGTAFRNGKGRKLLRAVQYDDVGDVRGCRDLVDLLARVGFDDLNTDVDVFNHIIVGCIFWCKYCFVGVSSLRVHHRSAVFEAPAFRERYGGERFAVFALDSRGNRIGRGRLAYRKLFGEAACIVALTCNGHDIGSRALGLSAVKRAGTGRFEFIGDFIIRIADECAAEARLLNRARISLACQPGYGNERVRDGHCRKGYRRRHYAEARGVVVESHRVKFKILQVRFQRSCGACADLALEGGDNRIRVASVVCRARDARYDIIRPLRKGNVVKTELGFEPCCQLARACNHGQPCRELQLHLNRAEVGNRPHGDGIGYHVPCLHLRLVRRELYLCGGIDRRGRCGRSDCKGLRGCHNLIVAARLIGNGDLTRSDGVIIGNRSGVFGSGNYRTAVLYGKGRFHRCACIGVGSGNTDRGGNHFPSD